MKLKKRNSIAEKLAQMASPVGLRALALVPAVSLRLGGKMALLGVNSILNLTLAETGEGVLRTSLTFLAAVDVAEKRKPREAKMSAQRPQ